MKELAASIVVIAGAFLLWAQTQTQSVDARMPLVFVGGFLCLAGIVLLATFGMRRKTE
jgi:hypothetical protein